MGKEEGQGIAGHFTGSDSRDADYDRSCACDVDYDNEDVINGAFGNGKRDLNGKGYAQSVADKSRNIAMIEDAKRNPKTTAVNIAASFFGIKAANSIKTSIWSPTANLSSVKNALQHWNKHQADFPNLKNANQYVEAAKNFLTNPPKGTLSKTRPNGDVARYNPTTNTFGVMNKNNEPKTMFSPKGGIDYWNDQ